MNKEQTTNNIEKDERLTSDQTTEIYKNADKKNTKK